MMKRGTLLRSLLEFVAITAALTWLWMHGLEDAYFKVFIGFTRRILVFLGVTQFPPSAVKSHFISFVPFIALMVITPALSLRRRLIGTGCGFLAIVVGQIGLCFWAYQSFVATGNTPQSMAKFFPVLVFMDGLPFLLWAVIAHEFVGGLLTRVIAPPAD